MLKFRAQDVIIKVIRAVAFNNTDTMPQILTGALLSLGQWGRLRLPETQNQDQGDHEKAREDMTINVHHRAFTGLNPDRQVSIP